MSCSWVSVLTARRAMRIGAKEAKPSVATGLTPYLSVNMPAMGPRMRSHVPRGMKRRPASREE